MCRKPTRGPLPAHQARRIPLTVPHLQLCYITDRRALGTIPLQSRIHQAIVAGIDLIQIREKDLSARALIELAQPAVQSARGTGTRILVNDRLDIALAVEAAGVHLGRESLPARAVRKDVDPGFLVGVSCHSLDEAVEAESAAADYVLLGPVFDTASKLQYGPALGLARLQEVAHRVRIPVLALGGITSERVRGCLDAGACGVAGISLFQNTPSLGELVQKLRSQFPG